MLDFNDVFLTINIKISFLFTLYEQESYLSSDSQKFINQYTKNN